MPAKINETTVFFNNGRAINCYKPDYNKHRKLINLTKLKIEFQD